MRRCAVALTLVAALVLSVRPDLKAPELKSILMKSATPLASLRGKIASGGMVNAYAALRLAANSREKISNCVMCTYAVCGPSYRTGSP